MAKQQWRDEENNKIRVQFCVFRAVPNRALLMNTKTKIDELILSADHYETGRLEFTCSNVLCFIRIIDVLSKKLSFSSSLQVWGVFNRTVPNLFSAFQHLVLDNIDEIWNLKWQTLFFLPV